MGVATSEGWSAQQVTNWMMLLGLPPELIKKFEELGVNGQDLTGVQVSDLTAMGCTPEQANLMIHNLAQFRTPVPQAAPQQQQQAPLVTNTMSVTNSAPVAPTPVKPVPAATAYSAPLPQYPPPTQDYDWKQGSGSQSYKPPVVQVAAPSSAAVAQPVGAQYGYPVPGAVGQPGGRTMVVHHESYCGPVSWIIGVCLFPCICFCPVDQRPFQVIHIQ